MPAKPPAESVRAVSKLAISAYPDDATRAAITRMAAELDVPEGRVLALCAAAVAEMTATGKLVVPRLVTMLHAIRKHGATLADEPRPWPNRSSPGKRKA